MLAWCKRLCFLFRWSWITSTACWVKSKGSPSKQRRTAQPWSHSCRMCRYIWGTVESWDSCRCVRTSRSPDCVLAGSASGGNAAETGTEHAPAAAGGWSEQPEGAAGGGRGGQEEPGETAEHHAGAGTCHSFPNLEKSIVMYHVQMIILLAHFGKSKMKWVVW